MTNDTPSVPTPKEFVDHMLNEEVEHAQVQVTLTGTPAQIHRGLKHMAAKKGGKGGAFKSNGKKTDDLEPTSAKGEDEEKKERIVPGKEDRTKKSEVKESASSQISKILGK